jgi:hypothetical protein
VVLGSRSASKIPNWTLAEHRRRAAVIEGRFFVGPGPTTRLLPGQKAIHGAEVRSSGHAESGISRAGWCIEMDAAHDRVPARETGIQDGDCRGKATPCAGRMNVGGVHRG